MVVPTRTVVYLTKPKFVVDASGWRELNERLDPIQLAREPVSNSYDEAEATVVKVTLTKDGNRPAVYTVEDDGPGFRDLKDAYTMFADTYKRRDATTRGRFNVGEKQLLAVALRGSIVTTSGSVTFDGNGRTTGRKRTERGTIVSVEVKWTKEQCDEVLVHLRTFVPPEGKTYIVNGVEVPHRLPNYKVYATLGTVLKDDGFLAYRQRETTVLVYRLTEGETPTLNELGIPIVPLTEFAVPFTLDVQQKVPMSPERDSVRPSYLQDVFAEVLNVVAKDLSEEESNAKWVNLAIPDPRIQGTTVQVIKDIRIGRSLILNPFDPLANERAIKAGYGVISTKGWDPVVTAAFRSNADWKSTSEVFPAPTPAAGTPVSTPGIERTRRFILALAKALDMKREPQVAFVNLPNAWAAADCGGTSITFYVNKCGKAVFDTPSVELLRLVAHEFAHIGPHGDSPYTLHDEVWGERGLRVMAFLALHPDLLDILMETKA